MPPDVNRIDASGPAPTQTIESDNEEDQWVDWNMFPQDTYQEQVIEKVLLEAKCEFQQCTRELASADRSLPGATQAT